MIELHLPKLTLSDIYEKCVNTKHQGDLKNRLLSSKQDMQDLEEDYTMKAREQQLHSIQEHDYIGTVTKKEMMLLYENNLVDSVSGRPLYDELISSAEYGICPLCSHGTVNTLDHYLPKSKYPGLAVTPINLIPACRDCNFDKLAETGRVAESMTLHPYFDSVNEYQWLIASVIEIFPIVFKFKVNETCGMNDILLNRTKSHFNSFFLGRVYAAQAGREFRARVPGLIKAYKSGGINSVRESIVDNLYTYKVENKNSWCTAMYRSLYESEWFINDACSKLDENYKL